MTTKSLKKFTELLNRSEGLSIIPIIAIMVIMSVMGVVFTSIMGGWKISAPMTVNSAKAYNLAETAAMFALQDASYRFFSKDDTGAPDFPAAASGTRGTPYVVSRVTQSFGTETAEFWIERPFPSTNDIDEYPPGTDRGNNDDDTSSADDDVVDDDADDADDDRRYTIIATGKVTRGSATVATRQVKILADIVRASSATVTPGVQTSGIIEGSGSNPSNHFGMSRNANSTGFTVGNDIDDPPGSEAGVVIRPPNVDTVDENFVKAMAESQGHYNAVDLTIDNSNNDYPEPTTPSFYYTGTVPNFTYVGQDLTVGANRKMYGVVWVKRDVTLNGTATMDAVIICEGIITFNGSSNILGGIIHYGSKIVGNGNPNAITVNDAFFNAMSLTIPIITVQSWQEAVSAN